MSQETNSKSPESLPKCFHEEVEKELLSKKVKWLTFSLVILAVSSYFSNNKLQDRQKDASFRTVTSYFIEVIGLNFFLKFKPGFIKYFLIFRVIVLNLIFQDTNNLSYFFHYAIAIMLPLKIFFLEERKSCFILLIIPQLIFFRNSSASIEEAINVLGPKMFSDALCLVSFCSFVFVALTLYGMQSNFKFYLEKLLLIEKQNTETEKQKLFILGFSHELRNLMNNIIGNIQIVMHEELEPKVLQCLNNAKLCGDVLLQLVNNILDSGKIDIGQLEINPKKVEIYPTIRDLWRVCHYLIKRNPLISGQLYISKALPPRIKVDSLRLAQVLFNLISNAYKYTAKGHIKIKVDWLNSPCLPNDDHFEPLPFGDDGVFSKEVAMLNFSNEYYSIIGDSDEELEPEFNNHASTEKGILKISVLDSGCGIMEDCIPKIFQKFSQLSSDNSKRQVGTGLGLFITKEICKASGGDIRVYSKEGFGSVFCLCLPCEVGPNYRTMSSGFSIASGPPKANQNCMIVEDDKMAQEVFIKMFRKIGYEPIKVAENGRQAFEYYKELVEEGKKIHFISMDINMPVLDGKEACKMIRKHEQKNGIDPVKIVMMSANCDQSEISECLDPKGEIMASEFIKKPISIKELKKTLDKVLEEY